MNDAIPWPDVTDEIAVSLFSGFKAAHGRAASVTWPGFVSMASARREGEKDGPAFVPAAFQPGPDGWVHRLAVNATARTMVVLDVETSKSTGEVAPSVDTMADRIAAMGLAGVVYSSHNHTAAEPRYRVVLRLSDQIPAHVPAVDVVAEWLGLSGVFDRSKRGIASMFYLPSCNPGAASDHVVRVLTGGPLDADAVCREAQARLDAADAAAELSRREALERAEEQRRARRRAGFDPDASIIEQVRQRLDLDSELLAHGYLPAGTDRYLYPGSETGVPGVHVMRGRDGVDRVYSHHSGDPLAHHNLPAWCSVKAIDVVDVVLILGHGGDQKAGLRALAEQMGIVGGGGREPAGGAPAAGAEAQQGDGAGDTAAAADVEPVLTIVCPTSLQDQPIPDREWVVDEWLPIGSVTANYGDGGTGKTLLAQQLQTAAAIGAPWCGLPVLPCRSFGLFCEDDNDELHRRQDAINRAMGCGFSALGDMRWASGVGLDCTLMRFVSDRTHVAKVFDYIEAQAAKFGARLVVLDTAADLFGGNENDRHEVRQFIGLLGGLAIRLKAAVLLNAHPSRSGLSSGNLDGGSTAWNNSVRSRWSLARPDAEKDGEEADPDARILTRRKSNYARIGDEIKLRWVNGVLALPTGAPSQSAAERAACEAVFMQLLAEHNGSGVYVSISTHAGNYAPKVFAKSPNRAGYGKRDFEKAMADLLAKHRIRNETYGRTSDERRRIVAVETSAAVCGGSENVQ